MAAPPGSLGAFPQVYTGVGAFPTRVVHQETLKKRVRSTVTGTELPFLPVVDFQMFHK